jgi:hypothetical protein
LIPSGFSLKLMIGRDFVVEDDGEVTGAGGGFFRAGRPDHLGLSALGDLASDFLEGILAGAGEVEGNGNTRVRFGFRFRFADVIAGEGRVVLEREPTRFGFLVEGAGSGFGRVFGDENDARRDFDDDPVFRPPFPRRAEVEVHLAQLWPRDQFMRLGLLEQVVARLRDRTVAAILFWFLFGGKQRRVVGARVGTSEDQLQVLFVFRRPTGFPPAFF